MRRESIIPKAQAAPWRAVTVLAVLFFFMANVAFSPQATPEHVTGHNALAVSSLHCNASETGSRQTHCQGATVGILGGQRLAVAFLTISGSSAWCYAAVTCGPALANQRLLRPPRTSLAFV